MPLLSGSKLVGAVKLFNMARGEGVHSLVVACQQHTRWAELGRGRGGESVEKRCHAVGCPGMRSARPTQHPVPLRALQQR